MNCAYRSSVCTFHESGWLWFYPHPHFFIQLFNEIQAETLGNVLRQKTLSLNIFHSFLPSTI